jgi:cyclophilin family peptidyl-prolyl cis-trans isomerase
VDVFGASPAEDKAKVLRGVYDASAGAAWIEIRTSIVDAVAQLEGGRGLLSHAARTDPARAVRDRAEAAHRALQLEPPQPSFAREAPAPWLGQRFDSDPVIRLETTKGTLELQLFAREAPVHVASVVRLVRDHFYDGLAWHRVVANFVIQGGDPQGTGWGGPGYALRDEINRVRFERGTLGMPKGGRDSGGSQLFITHVPAPHLDGRYTAFGRVISGIEVVDRIEVGDRIVTARMK